MSKLSLHRGCGRMPRAGAGVRVRNGVGVFLALAMFLAATGRRAAAADGGFIVPGVGVQGAAAGEILLGELNCTACHAASPAVAGRLHSRQAPLLGEAGARMTPQFLRAFLGAPQAEKPGTGMPDLLHGLDAVRKGETVDALVHFLASQAGETPEPAGWDEFRIRQGRQLYHTVGCVACHAPFETPSAVAARRSGEEGASSGNTPDLQALGAVSVPLGNLAKKTTVSALAKFLQDPAKVRPSGRMPSLNLTESEATSIAMYLLRDQAASVRDGSKPKQTLKGLAYQYFEGTMSDRPDFEAMPVTASGFTDRFHLGPRRRADNIGFRFTGLVRIPSAGTYTFFTRSDDGSRLHIGDRLVVQNDGMHAAEERQGTVELPAGDHPILVTYFNGGGESTLRVSWAGPGFAKQEIPAGALFHLGDPMVPLEGAPFTVDAAKAGRGRELFGSLGCASCHAMGGGRENVRSSISAKSLADLDAAARGGCLSEQPAAGVPRFGLSAVQRTALRVALEGRARLADPVSAPEQVRLSMARFNCYACHGRDGAGGPGAGGKGDYFAIVGDADLGDEGRIPPHLTGVGAKLRPDALRDILWNKAVARPYMATRMPQFGRGHLEGLADAFERADAVAPATVHPEPSGREAKIGRKLVGRDGLTCISCHRFGKYPSLGIPAIDLMIMGKRLQRDWFQRYLLDPASLRPGTRMPSFWPEGKAANREILGGETGAQISAIWAYLSTVTDSDVPTGLIRARQELVAEKEAIIYRNFIAGAGSRAIGVAYPEKANLAFDANDVRLALIWQGSFIDGSRHSTDRGVGFEPPLGQNVVGLPEGPAFAILEQAGAAWPKEAGKKAGFQFRGYRLDPQRRPTFLYQFRDVQVEDEMIAVAGDFDPGLRRTLTVRGGAAGSGTLYFRAATGSRIEPAGRPGEYVVDGKVTIQLATEGTAAKGGGAVVRSSEGRMELIVALPPAAPGGGRVEARLIETITW